MQSSTIAIPFGVLLKKRRLERKWSQRELAERARLSLRFVQSLEYGEQEPRLSTLYALACAFGITPVKLLEGMPNISSLPANDEVSCVVQERDHVL